MQTHCAMQYTPKKLITASLAAESLRKLRAPYYKKGTKYIIDFLSLVMVDSLKEIPEGLDIGQNALNQSCTAYPLSL